jgi:hypothetical protein
VSCFRVSAAPAFPFSALQFAKNYQRTPSFLYLINFQRDSLSANIVRDAIKLRNYILCRARVGNEENSLLRKHGRPWSRHDGWSIVNATYGPVQDAFRSGRSIASLSSQIKSSRSAPRHKIAFRHIWPPSKRSPAHYSGRRGYVYHYVVERWCFS